MATKGGEVIRTSDADYISLLLIVLCVLMLLALYALSQSPATADAGVPVPDEHSVQPGDTLWQIARRYYPNKDPRKMVWEIQRLNGMDSPVIYPGQILKLPK